MAGNKLIKAKVKDDKNKPNKSLTSNGDDPEEIDFSVIRKPIQTSITGFAQARKLFDEATEELKSLLSNECDLLYECKICRNLFRSLANFISHKRVYCTEKFNKNLHTHFLKTASMKQELTKIDSIEKQYQLSLEQNSDDERIPMTKDLTSVIENIAKSKSKEFLNSYSEDQQVNLQKIPSSEVAVFQNSVHDNDSMKSQILEIDHMISSNKAILQEDGSFEKASLGPNEKIETESVIQISDDDDDDNLKCRICKFQFATAKTLRLHMKVKHLESRLVYPCPDCMDIFSTSWSVYRHLFKVHRKTAAQIRRLRESVQSKAFRMDNPPAFYERKKNHSLRAAAANKLTDNERIDQENQAWMEGLAQGPKTVSGATLCAGCGRSFPRRAALAAHAHTCLAKAQRRLQVHSRKDSDKRRMDSADNKTVDVAKIDTDKKDENEDPIPDREDLEEAIMEIPEEQADITDTATTETKDADEIDDIAEAIEKEDVPNRPIVESIESFKLQINLPYAQKTENNNFVALKKKILPDMDFSKLECKKCGVDFDDVGSMCEHYASHYKWMRYACKLCNFKNFDFSETLVHVKTVHKLKGDSDFYHSTVKAIDGNEAMELADSVEEVREDDKSPESRRPSRCSSDSSRLSDDSSSSGILRLDNSRKRKMYQNTKSALKKRKDDTADQKDSDLSNDMSNSKNFEENSSDIEDVEDRSTKRLSEVTIASRRPVRKRTKPKNEDFEYDLSNLLKMEAQGYRGTQNVSQTKTTQVKKKQPEGPSYDVINRDCCGALVSLSMSSVESAKAHLKTPDRSLFRDGPKLAKNPNIFTRPLPKAISKSEKSSPKKDFDVPKEEINDVLDQTAEEQPSNVAKQSESLLKPSEQIAKVKMRTAMEKIKANAILEELNRAKEQKLTAKYNIPKIVYKPSDFKAISSQDSDTVSEKVLTQNDEETTPSNCDSSTNSNDKGGALNVVPVKYRRQSMDLIKNPLIEKNIKDFTKAGMKTKILVIKPINRNKDAKSMNYKTIKLKDTNQALKPDDKSSDSIVLVKVPSVDSTNSLLKDAKFVTTDKKISILKKGAISSSLAKCIDNAKVVCDLNKKEADVKINHCDSDNNVNNSAEINKEDGKTAVVSAVKEDDCDIAMLS